VDLAGVLFAPGALPTFVADRADLFQQPKPPAGSNIVRIYGHSAHPHARGRLPGSPASYSRGLPDVDFDVEAHTPMQACQRWWARAASACTSLRTRSRPRCVRWRGSLQAPRWQWSSSCRSNLQIQKSVRELRQPRKEHERAGPLSLVSLPLQRCWHWPAKPDLEKSGSCLQRISSNVYFCWQDRWPLAGVQLALNSARTIGWLVRIPMDLNAQHCALWPLRVADGHSGCARIHDAHGSQRNPDVVIPSRHFDQRTRL
jgi:hypothetical protein